MFLGNLLKILFFMVLIYFIYNVIKAAFIVKGNVNDFHRRMSSQKNRDSSDRNTKQENGSKTIELDEDQYKVE